MALIVSLRARACFGRSSERDSRAVSRIGAAIGLGEAHLDAVRANCPLHGIRILGDGPLGQPRRRALTIKRRCRTWLRMIIAIDGPAASGKGTLGKRLAQHYGYRHLDTGVIYRAVAKALLDGGHDLTDEARAVKAAKALDLETFGDPE